MLPATSRSVALGALLLAAISSPMRAQTIDQSNPATNIPAQSIFWSGQTFTPAANTVVGGGFNLFAFNGVPVSGTLFVQLWSDIPSNLGATLLAGGITPFSLAAGAAAFFDAFWAPVNVTPLATYFLAVYGTFDAQFGVAVQMTFTVGDTYPNGSGFSNFSSVVTDPYIDFLPSADFSLCCSEPASPASSWSLVVAELGSRKKRDASLPRPRNNGTT